MNDLGNTFLTATLTVLAGVIVYVAGQLADKFFIEPYKEYRKVVGEIAVSMVLYANVTSSMVDMYIQGFGTIREQRKPGWELYEERAKQIIDGEFNRIDGAALTLRMQASQLVSAANAITLYGIWARLGFVPSMKNINVASRALIGFSNIIISGHRALGDDTVAQVSKALRITILTAEGGY